MSTLGNVAAATTSATINYTVFPIYHYQLKDNITGTSITCGQLVSFQKNTGSTEVTRTGSFNDSEHNIEVNWSLKQYGVNDSTNFSGKSYVDLSLSSGLLWATCNVGASSPEDYGSYFAWGATKSRTTSSAPNKDLTLEYDAAHVNMGGDWRMPTNDEMTEMITNTITAVTTVNSIKGVTFTSKSDSSKSIFIPFAGYINPNNVTGGIGTAGRYWTKTYNNGTYSYVLVESTSTPYVTERGGRTWYFSVRGVCEKSSGETPTSITYSLGLVEDTEDAKYFDTAATINYYVNQTYNYSDRSEIGNPLKRSETVFFDRNDTEEDVIRTGSFTDSLYNVKVDWSLTQKSISEEEEVTATTYTLGKVNDIDDVEAYETATTVYYTIIPTYHYKSKSEEGSAITCTHNITFSPNTTNSEVTRTGYFTDTLYNVLINWALKQKALDVEGKTKAVYSDGVIRGYDITGSLTYSKIAQDGKYLVSVECSSAITSLDNNAFASCKYLESFVMTDSITSIGASAFDKCTSLTSITMSNSVKVIDYYAFLECGKISAITIGNSVTTIKDYAFESCSSLRSISFPHSLKEIQDWVFENTSNVTTINYNGTISEWKAITKGTGWSGDIPSSTVVTCTDGTTSIN